MLDGTPAAARGSTLTTLTTEKDAAARIASEYGPLLLRVAAGYTDNAADRDDLVQEILIAIWRALPAFRGEASERTFILRIAHNRSVSFSIRLRSFERLPEGDAIADPNPTPDAELQSAELRERLQAAIRKLPAAQREAVMLQLEGMSRKEIAAIQGTTENNVGVRLTRASHALHALIGEP